jgi:hypothetical protein
MVQVTLVFPLEKILSVVSLDTELLDGQPVPVVKVVATPLSVKVWI